MFTGSGFYDQQEGNERDYPNYTTLKPANGTPQESDEDGIDDQGDQCDKAQKLQVSTEITRKWPDQQEKQNNQQGYRDC
jgi:hypothetical protein